LRAPIFSKRVRLLGTLRPSIGALILWSAPTCQVPPPVKLRD
jgi:hypothetical protein